MRIGIDASRANVRIRTGTEWYSYFIIREILKQNTTDEFVLYVKEPLVEDMSDWAERATIRVLTWKPKFLWNLIRLSWEMFLHRPDVLFVPAHTIPFIHPKKTVTTCHDIGFERYPLLYATKTIGPRNKLLKRLIWLLAKIFTFGRYGNTELDYHRFSMRLAVNSAARIITPSKFTAREIHEVFRCPYDKMTEIHHGLNPQYASHYSEVDRAAVLSKFNIEQPYLLFIGRWEDKKNIGPLLKAFELLITNNQKISLVLIGAPGWGFDRAWASIQPTTQKRIRLCANVETEAPILMSGATAFVFPSAYEGFGLPIIEAMASSVPVITTHCGSIPEIAGEAVIYCSADDPKDLATSIEQTIADNSLRFEYIKRGLARVGEFNWQKSGKDTLRVLCEWVF